MRKLLLLVLSAFMLGTAANAQDKKGETPKQTTTKEGGARTKKDGTPDKRYKDNKEARATREPEAPAGPTKKDGTPDKRYKENKEARATKEPEAAGPTKKDGTPDMRYKANATKPQSGKDAVNNK
jgi:hypothetical protein